jgi:ATP-dependent Clp protease adaptor protein ClpS
MAGTQTQIRPETTDKPKTKQPWLWNVVLLNDEEHTYEYVIKMMQEVFAHDLEKSFTIAVKVDGDGRAVCTTTHKEHAELKRDQIHAFGRDPLMAVSKGSMSAVIEPAWGEDEGQNK